MIVTVRIVGKGQFDYQLPGVFPIGDKIRILTSEFDYKDCEPFYGEAKDNKNPAELNRTFTKSVNEYKIEYELNDNGEPKTAFDAKKKRVIEDFYCVHPLCTVNGKPHRNTKNPMFDVRDDATSIVNEMTTWNNKRRAANTLADMDLESLRDVAFYYGRNPVGKSKGQLIIELAHFQSGVIVASNDEFIRNFMMIWSGEGSDERTFVVNCNKAIKYGIITTQVKEGRQSYYLGTTLLGFSIEEVIKHLKGEPDLYRNHVLRGISERDVFTEELAASEAEGSGVKAFRAEEAQDWDDLKRKAIELYKQIQETGTEMPFQIQNIYNKKGVKVKDVYDQLIKLRESATA